MDITKERCLNDIFNLSPDDEAYSQADKTFEDIKAEFLTDSLKLIGNLDIKRGFHKLLSRYSITDEIDINSETVERVQKRLGLTRESRELRSADIVLADMVSLKYVRVNYGVNCFDVVIFSPEEFIDTEEGAVIGLYRNKDVLAEVLCEPETDRLFLGKIFFPDYCYDEKKISQNPNTYVGAYMEAVVRFGNMIEIWKLIQLCMLHPVYKDVFSSSTRVKSENKHSKKTPQKARKIKYYRKHIIRLDDVEKADTQAKFERKTMVWYVMGHWRTSKNGNRYFVKPFWKGPLRESKKQSSIRDREIVTN